MITPEMQREYAISVAFDHLTAMNGSDDDPFSLYADFDAHWAEAEAAVDARIRGEGTMTTWLVVPHDNTLGYTAVPLQDGVAGCRHDISAPTLALGRAEAVAEHRRKCLGY